MAFPSPGETGGIFAGAVAALVAVGHGIKWWLGWTDKRAATRASKLDAWQKELEAREKRFIEAIEAELNQLRREHAALLGGYQLLAAALRVADPDNDALRRGDELLRTVFPLDPQLPPGMAGLAAKLNEIP